MRRSAMIPAVTAALLSVVAPVSAAPDAPVAAPTGGAAMTKVVLHVQTCRQCPVRLVQADIDDPADPGWSTVFKKVRRGQVAFRIPTRRTEGMATEVVPRWEQSNARPLVVMRYAGTSPGEVVTAREARRQNRASGCWAGTGASRVDLRVRAVRSPQNLLRVWTRTSRSSTPPMRQAPGGRLVTQEIPYCDP